MNTVVVCIHYDSTEHSVYYVSEDIFLVINKHFVFYFIYNKLFSMQAPRQQTNHYLVDKLAKGRFSILLAGR